MSDNKKQNNDKKKRKGKNAGVTISDRILGIADANDLDHGIPRFSEEYTHNENNDPDAVISAQREDFPSGPPAATRKSLRNIPNSSPAPNTRKSLATGLPAQGRKSVVGRKSLAANVAGAQQQSQPVNTGPNSSNPRINFHQGAVHEGLKRLEQTSRVFIQKKKHDDKRWDIVESSGTLICQLLDFTQELDLTSINICLLAADGEKQLLMMQGDSGFLGFNGELISRYPGSLPGDQELILGYAVQTTSSCSLNPQYYVKDSTKAVRFQLKDTNKRCYLSPFRLTSQCKLEIRKPGHLTVYGLIEERSPTSNNNTNNINNNNNNNARRSNKNNRLSNGYPLQIKGKGKRIRSNHFCIGFHNSLNFKDRALLISAHVLLNYDHFGKKKCTRFVFVIIMTVIAALLLIGGVCAAMYFLIILIETKKARRALPTVPTNGSTTMLPTTTG